MRVLLDENIPHKIRFLFESHFNVFTVAYVGWRGKKNGELLAAAEKEFDAFVTIDQGLPYQQNLKELKMGIILLEARSNRYKDLASLITKVNVALQTLKYGQIVRIAD